MAQTWNSEGYANNARFVTDLGAPVLALLDPRPGERILDLGCGDGVLTKKIADFGCKVVGVDSSPDFVASAKKLGLEIIERNASNLNFSPSFDAVFSNAALHWMKDADAVIGGVARALRPDGRFVAEMGGHDCVKTIQSALIDELDRRGYDGQAANPWYFPTVEDYGARLVAAGFEVRYIALIPRPTPLPGDMMGWLATFSGCFTAVLPNAEREDYLKCVRQRVRPYLCDAQGNWTADYVRLRFAAHLGFAEHR
ncbi:MAG: class I SAM-dependent methyltransferase [Steroidobacteraceae bacterium]